MGQGAFPPPGQWPQPLRSHLPALQWPSRGCGSAPQPAHRYTLTNLSAALLELSGCPNFRPTWRYYSWHLSLLGAALTLGAMFFLNPGCATTYHPHPHP